jgi:hypothetical protein
LKIKKIFQTKLKETGRGEQCNSRETLDKRRHKVARQMPAEESSGTETQIQDRRKKPPTNVEERNLSRRRKNRGRYFASRTSGVMS